MSLPLGNKIYLRPVASWLTELSLVEALLKQPRSVTSHFSVAFSNY